MQVSLSESSEKLPPSESESFTISLILSLPIYFFCEVFSALTLVVGVSMFLVLHTKRSAAVTSRGYFRTACFDSPKIFYGVRRFGCRNENKQYAVVDSKVRPADGARVLYRALLCTYKR